MEPLTVSDGNPARGELDDLAFRLTRDANRLAGRLAPAVVSAIGDLVRSTNCYCSSLIEGHETHPIDIERAMAKDFAADPEKRDLQLEAVAHIEVQKWIDDGGDGEIAGLSALTAEIHKRFYERLPPALRQIKLPGDEGVRIEDGR
jgi:hypothetical protein